MSKKNVKKRENVINCCNFNYFKGKALPDHPIISIGMCASIFEKTSYSYVHACGNNYAIVRTLHQDVIRYGDASHAYQFHPTITTY